MKKVLLLLSLLSFFLGVYAQEEGSAAKLKRHFVVKFQPVNYVLQSYSFEVEAMLNKKNALTLGVGIPNNGSLLGKYGIKESDDLQKLELNTMHARLAYRHYSGNSGLPRGFYIEPYLKYQKFKADATINIGDDEEGVSTMLRSQPIAAVMAVGANNPAGIVADFNSLNAGFQMGVQFMIAKRIAVDFYFLGLEAGMLNGTLTGTPNDPSKVPDMRDEIDKALQDLPSFVSDKLTVTNNSSSVTVKASKLPYPWLRGGINIGIAF